MRDTNGGDRLHYYRTKNIRVNKKKNTKREKTSVNIGINELYS